MTTDMSAVMTGTDQSLHAERTEVVIPTAIAKDTDPQCAEEVAAIRPIMAHRQIEQ